MPRWEMSLEERFWSRVDKSGDCWVWTGRRNWAGYGQIGVKDKRLGAHRVAWELINGPIPEGMCVLHDCPDGDNPACVNPAHLWLGTQADNIRDMDRKGRSRRIGLKGEVNPNAKLTADQVVEIRQRYAHESITQTALADEYGVTDVNISDIVNRKTWKELPRDLEAMIENKDGAGNAA